jgi:hypothetical protein
MEKRSPRRGKNLCRVLPLGALLAAVGLVPAAFAFLVPGGGKPEADCYVELDLTGVTASQVVKGKKVTCMDGDPCDADSLCNNSCTFDAAICVNQNDPALASCTPPAALSSFKVNAMGLVLPSPGTSGENCSDRVSVVVPLKGNKNKNGKRAIAAKAKQTEKPKTDEDKYQLICTKRVGACPTTTTTTLPAASLCGDGTVTGTEQCDPPCGAGCGAGQLCNSECQCVTQAACACGTPEPNQLAFRTVDGAGLCGEVLDANGMSLTVNAAPNNTPGLNCGGLYFGGRGNSVPLPNSVPNNGMSITNVCCSGTELTAIGATAAETGSIRNCTSTGCLFGSPLPVVNPTNPGTSTCVVNVIGSPARGTGNCTTGESTLIAPLESQVFLAGDLLFNCIIGNTTPPDQACGSDAECGPGGLCPTGVQPCPVCRGPSGSETCAGGPNNGMACTPETSTTGDPYPTSHDCPPDPMLVIGSLPIGFSLSTGTVTAESKTLGTERVFCGFCRDADETLCFEGDPMSPPCPSTAGALHPCTSNADCAQPYESCEQNQFGAFAPGGGSAQTVRLFGSPSGDITDRLEHAATLASFFCVPPTYDAIIDAAGNLPGPGAVTLPGFAQLLPSNAPTTTTTTSTTSTTL